MDILQSCGVIPYRYNANNEIEFFVGHPGHHSWADKNYWLYIKGHREEYEDPLTTAKREFKEETGISLDVNDSDYIYLGEIQQSRYKKCIAYGLYYPDIDPSKCRSGYDENGELEIDKYEWKTFNNLARYTHVTHHQFYQSLIDMTSIRSFNEYNGPMVEDDIDILDDSGY